MGGPLLFPKILHIEIYHITLEISGFSNQLPIAIENEANPSYGDSQES